MRFINAEVFVNGRFRKSNLEVLNGKFTNINSIISEDDTVECTDKLILPGFIDVHTHGCIGYDFTTATVSQIKRMCDFYISKGVTSILATSMTINYPIHQSAMKNIKKAMNERMNGSRIIGINMEGPFLGIEKKGAHDERHLRPINYELFDDLNTLSGDNIRMVDIDPCLDQALEFIAKYSKTKVISLAHTNCDYDLAVKAIQAGASHVTHLFNAMNGLHHRNPGIIGAVSDYQLNAELICDGIHIHPSVIRMIYKSAADSLLFISDSMSAAGLDEGMYEIGGQKVIVQGGKATLQNGTLAGSTINIHSAFKNALHFGIPIEKAILSATFNPAKAIHAEHEIGSIAVGKRADFIIMDQNYDIEKVYKDGICVYKNAASLT